LSNVQTLPSLFLILMGSLDCLTTVIGTLYFGTVELNPLIAGLVNTNIAAFVFVKLSVTVFVGLVFLLANKTLLKTSNQDSYAFKAANKVLKIAYFGIVFFLVIVVTNNIMVLLKIVG
jgi:hypothetical protein